MDNLFFYTTLQAQNPLCLLRRVDKTNLLGYPQMRCLERYLNLDHQPQGHIPNHILYNDIS